MQPLALIGLWHEVLNWMARRQTRGIENRIAGLPDIYMGICYYKPGKRFTGLFPVQDTIQQVTETAAGFVPGSTLTDAAGAVGDMYSHARKMFGSKAKTKAPSLASNEVYIKFTYLPEDGMKQVGSRLAAFKDLHPQVRDTLSAMSGL